MKKIMLFVVLAFIMGVTTQAQEKIILQDSSIIIKKTKNKILVQSKKKKRITRSLYQEGVSLLKKRELELVKKIKNTAKTKRGINKKYYLKEKLSEIIKTREILEKKISKKKASKNKNLLPGIIAIAISLVFLLILLLLRFKKSKVIEEKKWREINEDEF